VSIAQVKQIAGRAGRYRTAPQALREAQIGVSSIEASPTAPRPAENLGLVTTLYDVDLPYIHEAMKADLPPLTSGGIQPPSDLVKRFSAYFPPSAPFRFILKRLFDSSITHHRYFVARNEEQLLIADAIEDIKGINVPDRYVISLCPVNLRGGSMLPILRAFAKCIANRSGGGFLEIADLHLEVLDRPLSAN